MISHGWNTSDEPIRLLQIASTVSSIISCSFQYVAIRWSNLASSKAHGMLVDICRRVFQVAPAGQYVSLHHVMKSLHRIMETREGPRWKRRLLSIAGLPLLQRKALMKDPNINCGCAFQIFPSDSIPVESWTWKWLSSSS